MENLQGGTIALEHRYDVLNHTSQRDHVTLYQGIQEPFEQPITIKVFALPQDPAWREQLLTRHFDAAYQTSRLRHDGLLRTIDHGELERGVPFIITERVEGTSLQELLLEQGTLSPKETLTLIQRLAQALDYLHGVGLVHGSISPSWVIIPADRGLAGAVLDHAMLGLTLEETLQMDEGQLPRQTIATLAPEMFRHERELPTIASDVWSLGALAYTCLVGVHPYFQDLGDPLEAIAKIKAQPPRSLGELGVEQAVSEVIHKALALEPDARWSDTLSFAQAFERAIFPPLNTSLHSPAPDSRASYEASAPARSPQETLPAQPTRTGTIAGLALLLLVVTNLAWCGFSFSQKTSGKAAELRAQAQTSQATGDSP